MKKIFIAVIICFSSVMSFAAEPEREAENTAVADATTPVVNATSQIQGKVIDKKTGEALAGVAINLSGSEFKTYTDFDGNFTFDAVTAGTYDLNVKIVSYEEITLKKISTGKPEVKLKVELESASPNI